ncbi:TetR/AcrR family transcriptional regulator [Mycobacterium sp. TY814]|uniref:TetR/AcrR family transcriptional regulator n=1 Tax=unclassified Mycobacterium TaxID=2642494 RepID=UPI0026A95D5B|nr:TetR/AcrR family transcriptional regulator [Mycobacterium sp. TY814]MDP7725065.1 TetR/AcrR family transcriptional regulator [Mycobacterium sp. TY814]
MADMTSSARARRWAKTDETQRRILDAATQVFANKGFTAATIAEVVSGSGASIGSIYHHFGGKSELFMAIFEQMADTVDRRIRAALNGPGSATQDRRRLFQLHVRAYLAGMWENRHAARVLSSGDTPPGFEVTRRKRLASVLHNWMEALDMDTSPRQQLMVRVLIATVAESTLMVIGCDDPTEVPPIIDATIEWIDQITE